MKEKKIKLGGTKGNHKPAKKFRNTSPLPFLRIDDSRQKETDRVSAGSIANNIKSRLNGGKS